MLERLVDCMSWEVGEGGGGCTLLLCVQLFQRYLTSGTTLKFLPLAHIIFNFSFIDKLYVYVVQKVESFFFYFALYKFVRTLNLVGFQYSALLDKCAENPPPGQN